MSKLNNIKIKQFRKFLKKHNCKYIRTKGGHEIWHCPECLRPIIFQTHIEPIPEFVIRQNLRTMNISIKDFLADIK